MAKIRALKEHLGRLVRNENRKTASEDTWRGVFLLRIYANQIFVTYLTEYSKVLSLRHKSNIQNGRENRYMFPIYYFSLFSYIS